MLDTTCFGSCFHTGRISFVAGSHPRKPTAHDAIPRAEPSAKMRAVAFGFRLRQRAEYKSPNVVPYPKPNDEATTFAAFAGKLFRKRGGRASLAFWSINSPGSLS